MKFQVPAILTRIGYLKDKGLSLGFSTNELTDEEKVLISKAHQSFGWLLFSENTLKEEEVPKEDAEFGRKTQSERIRGTLYRYWQKLGSKGDSETFYRQETEKIIEHYKSKLN